MTASPFKIVTFTPAAIARVKSLIDQSGDRSKILCLGVKNGGCAGMSYTLDWVEPAPHLDIIEEQGIKCAVDPKAVLFLLGSQIDYQESKLSSGFVFNNPNQTSACGCGESVALSPASPDHMPAH
jgi:iron-sulfur cluster assembly protein